MRNLRTLSVLREPLRPRSITRRASQTLPGQLQARPLHLCHKHRQVARKSVSKIARFELRDGWRGIQISYSSWRGGRSDVDSYQSQACIKSLVRRNPGDLSTFLQKKYDPVEFLLMHQLPCICAYDHFWLQVPKKYTSPTDTKFKIWHSTVIDVYCLHIFLLQSRLFLKNFVTCMSL